MDRHRQCNCPPLVRLKFDRGGQLYFAFLWIYSFEFTLILLFQFSFYFSSAQISKLRIDKVKNNTYTGLVCGFGHMFVFYFFNLFHKEVKQNANI